jgi:Ca2+/H+ antiporter
MLTGPNIILTLKVLVTAVTVLLAVSLLALAFGRRRLHGHLNTAFFILTMSTVVGFELLLRFVVPVAETFSPEERQALRVHLCFAVPAAVILPFMLYTGKAHRRKVHKGLSWAFAVLWIGTFVTGLFYLPHAGNTILPGNEPVQTAARD